MKYWTGLLPLVLLMGEAAHAQTAQEIVIATDKVRNPGEPFRTSFRLTEYVSGQERNHDSLVVFSKEDPGTHQFRNLVQYIEPERHCVGVARRYPRQPCLIDECGDGISQHCADGCADCSE